MTWAYRPRACCPARAPPPRKATADAHPGREPCWRTGKSPATAVPPLTAAQQQTGIIGGMLQAPSSLSAPAAEEAPIYVARRPWRSRMVPVRTMEYHVREWGPVDGDPALAPLVLVHGWMDVAASYQFVVHAFGEAFMAGRRHISPGPAGFRRSPPPRPAHPPGLSRDPRAPCHPAGSPWGANPP